MPRPCVVLALFAALAISAAAQTPAVYPPPSPPPPPTPTLQCNAVLLGNVISITYGSGTATVNEVPVLRPLFRSCLSWTVIGTTSNGQYTMSIRGTDGYGSDVPCSQFNADLALNVIQKAYNSTSYGAFFSATAQPTVKCCDATSFCNNPLSVTFSSSSSRPASASLLSMVAALLFGFAFISKASKL